MNITAEVLVWLDERYNVSGRSLRIDVPISFWGDVDPETGMLLVARGVTAGTSIAGSILMLETPRGSSSSSAVILELSQRNLAPAAVILRETDAILGIGAIVAAEMGWRAPPFLRLADPAFAQLPQNAVCSVFRDGRVVFSKDRS
jgi:predicted aconitase with swiveling domain